MVPAISLGCWFLDTWHTAKNSKMGNTKILSLILSTHNISCSRQPRIFRRCLDPSANTVHLNGSTNELTKLLYQWYEC